MISWSQGFTPSTTMITTIFEDWYTNKKRFIDWFGNKLIHEIGEVDFHIDKDKREVMINDFLDQCGHIMKYDEYSILYQFVKLNKETFFSNLVSNTTVTFDKPIAKGMKLSKAFKYFIEDKEMLIHIQQLASSYIQKDRIHGKLCFSVHPLDYLSASETTYNWRSCHALDGEYRAGNLSYMTDGVTICCYIKGEDEAVLPDFPQDVKWNSKKWRMWIHISEDSNYCFLGRQYPFTLDGIPEKIQCLLPGDWDSFTDWHFSVANTDDGLSFRLNRDYIPLNTGWRGYELFPEPEVIEEGSQLNYNDLLHSSYYKPYYSSRRNISKDVNKPKIVVGHEVKCLVCGKTHIDPGEGLMVCYDCAQELGLRDYGICCADCGEYVDEDEITYLHDGTPVCQNCLSDYYYCENCGEYFRDDEIVWSEKYQQYFCNECFENIRDEEIAYCRKYHIYDED